MKIYSFVFFCCLIGILGACKKSLVEPAYGEMRPSVIKLSSTDGWKRVLTKVDSKTTFHGQKRIAGPNATRGRVLSQDERYDTKYNAIHDGKVFKQDNGPIVYLDKQPSGKYNGLVESNKSGLITTMKEWSPLELAKMGRNQHWPDKEINDLRAE